MTPPCRILDLNNHAVEFLRQGDHHATAFTLHEVIKSLDECFQRAEKILRRRPATTHVCGEPAKKKRRRSLGSSDTSITAEKCISDADKTSEYIAIRSITVSPVATDLSVTGTSGLNDETAVLMVYNRAFGFSCIDATSLGFGSRQSKTRLEAILLYNLGLSYHRQGTSGDLKMALKFYRKAYMVLKSAWAQSDFKEVFVLLIALLNNMACIHCYFGDTKYAHQCVNWMNRAVVSRQRCTLPKDDYCFFSLNLSVFRGHQLRLASAA